MRAFATTADLAIAIALVAVTISTLRSGQRPRRVRSWLFFASASIALFVHAALASFDLADLASLFEVLTLALFALGVVVLYGADREQLRSIESHAERDATTGLLNRRAFRELARDRLRKSRAPVAVAVMDLDGFKQVNDSRGHLEGDKILELVATSIRVNLRTSDIACRYGGDEFVVLLEASSASEARRVLERMRTIIASVTAAAGASVTASIGVALSSGATADLDELIGDADHALMAVKRAGKDQLRVATSASHAP